MHRGMRQVGQGDRDLEENTAHIAYVDDGWIRSGNGKVVDNDGCRVGKGVGPLAKRVIEDRLTKVFRLVQQIKCSSYLLGIGARRRDCLLYTSPSPRD